MPFDLTFWQVLALLSKMMTYAGSFMAVGMTLYLLATPQLSDDLRRPIFRAIVIAVLVAATGAAAQFTVQSGRLLDDGLTGMFDRDMLSLVAGAPLGESIVIRLFGLALLMAFALNSPIGWLFGTLGAATTAGSFSFVGHGTADPRLLLASLVTIHLLGISFWLGALWPLHRVASRSDRLDKAGELAHRFGQQAAWVVSGLVVAGGILIWLIVGSPFDLIASQYGWTLLAKLAVVAALLGLAAWNKLRLVPALKAGNESAAQSLRRSIALEAGAFVAIFIITAVLTTITPLPETMELST